MRLPRRILLVAALAVASPSFSLAAAPIATRRPAARWDVGVGPMFGESDMLGPVEVQPIRRSLVGAALTVSRLGGSGWWIGSSFSWGGTWSDFDGPPIFVAGNFKSIEWSVGLVSGAARCLGDRSRIRGGLEVWYGEQRSWLRSRDVAVDGPRAFLSGGAVRIRADHRLARRLELFAETRAGAYRAQATDRPLQVHHRWLGETLSLTTGLSWALAVGKQN
jgi:hypothetical protein